MYYRRKIILALINEFGNKLSKLDLQKLLFIFTQQQQNAVYNFVPYKFGCYSFQAASDLSTLSKYKLISETEKNYQLKTNDNYFNQLTIEDQKTLNTLKKTFGNYSTDELIRYVYRNYPFYAINSSIAKDKLTNAEFKAVNNVRPISNKTLLFTIGYEGISVEEYFNRLIINDVKVLCDVRNFPRSMKFGFSKNQLKKICDGLGIMYVHLPGLGISSDKRKNLSVQEDYEQLFNEYKLTTLKSNSSDQSTIMDLIRKHKRVALTCFENNVHQCHRFHLANSVAKLSEGKIKTKHL